MIKLFYPYVPDEAVNEVEDTLNSIWIGQAHKVDKFEKDYEKKFNVPYAVSLNSGSSALETAFELAGIGQGDEVITSPLTCTATNIPLLRMGAKIIWADIGSNLCLDPVDVRRKLTEKTKAVVNVHLGGIENNLGDLPVPVIADACQALGVFNGTYTCNSFQAIKHITTGDGGMLTVNTPEEYKSAKLKRWFGIDREKKIQNNWQAYTKRQMTFDIETIGYKRQMTDIAAGMGIAGLQHYDEVLAHRTKLYELYKSQLKGVQGIRVVDAKKGCKNVVWLCTVLVERRDDFAEMLFNAEVETNLVQIRNDRFKIFWGNNELPYMDSVEDKYISLPLHMKVTEEDVMYITKKIKEGW